METKQTITEQQYKKYKSFVNKEMLSIKIITKPSAFEYFFNFYKCRLYEASREGERLDAYLFINEIYDNFKDADNPKSSGEKFLKRFINIFPNNVDKNYENMTYVVRLLYEKMDDSIRLFAQEELSNDDIRYFLTGKSLTENEKQVSDDCSENSESGEQSDMPDDTDTTVSDSETPNPEGYEKKESPQIDKIKIPIRRLNALKKNGYIEDTKHPYKWIKLATKTKGISRVSLFDFCLLNGDFKSKDTAQKRDFVNYNFQFDKPIESSDFGRHNQPDYKSEYYEELEKLIKDT